MTDGDDPANPLTLSQEELLEAMQGSGGYVCFRYQGVGESQYLRWHPDLQQFEVITQYNQPTLEGGVVVIQPGTREHYAVRPEDIGDWLPDRPSAVTEAHLEPVRYNQTPFPDAGAPEGTWGEAEATGVDVRG